MAVQIAVIDDWQDVARDVVDWSVLDSIGEVTLCMTTRRTTPHWPSDWASTR